MAMSRLWLVAQCGVGVWVLVRCFVFKEATEHQIIERLGDGFSRPVFATIVVLGTLVSLSGYHTPGRTILLLYNSYQKDSKEAIKAGAKARASSSVLCPVSVSNMSSPPHASQVATPSPLPSNTDHFKPIYQSLANQSPLSSRAVELSVDNAASSSSLARLPVKKTEPNIRENTKKTVYIFLTARSQGLLGI